MSATITTAVRVLTQLHHDKRTIAMIFVVPCVLTILLKYVFHEQPLLFNHIAPVILGIFPLIIMFLVTAIATLRERTSGTLDRLMTLPISKSSLIFGYALAFSLLGLVQACLTATVALWLLDVPVAGGAILMISSAVISAFLGTSLGLFVSAYARSEFQAVQFMPVFIMPQLLVGGLFVPIEAMAKPLQWLASIMPLTYSVDAMQLISTSAGLSKALVLDFVVVISCGIIALGLGAVSIRRKD